MAKTPPSVKRYLAAQLKKARAAKAAKAKLRKSAPPAPATGANDPAALAAAIRQLKRALG